LTLLSTEMKGFSRYALASAMRLLLKGLPDPTDIFCGIVIPAVRCATGLANPLPILELSCLLIVPHSLQVLLVGSNRGILITFRPASSALSESNLKNLPQLASLIDLARWWFLTIPLIFRSWLDYIYKIIVGDLYHHVPSFKKSTLVLTPVPCCIVVNPIIIPNISMG